MNDQGTHWVLLCRKAKPEEGEYNDIAMLGHNPYTGKTCYFQNTCTTEQTGFTYPILETLASPASPEQTESLWSVFKGTWERYSVRALSNSDPFIHTP